MTASLLLDEMFSPRIAAELAERGYDCRSVAADPRLRERPDDALFAGAVAEQRILVTENVVDFERLRRDRVAATAGVPPLIYTSSSAFPRDRRYVRRLVEALDGALKTDAVTRHGCVLWLSATP
jgi:predicted nuclease of predicted toxin-antitoxin system